MKKSEIKTLQSEHRRAIKKREPRLKAYEENKKYYAGAQWSEDAMAQYNEPVVDNMVFKTITTILPAVFVRNPHVYVTPTKKPFAGKDGAIFNTLEAASLVEVLLNYYIGKLQLKRELRRAGLDASLGGPGYIQCGYDVTSEIVDSEPENEDDEPASDVTPNELIQDDSPWFMRRAMKDVLIDPNCTDHLLNDAEWIAFREVRRLSDVKADKSLKNTKELEPNYSPTDDEKKGAVVSPSTEGERGGDRWLEYWIRWDKRRKKVITYVEDEEKIMSETEWPIDYNGFPLEVLYWNEKPDDLYPMSDVDLMRHQQDFLNRLESLQLDHVRRISSAKYVYTEGAIDENETSKLTHGPSGTLAAVKTSPPSSAIEPLRDNAVSQDQYMLAGQVKNNIREVLGVAAYENGASQKFDTAAEPELIQQGINIKRDDRKDMVADFWKRILKKLLVILQETMEETELPLSEGQFNQAKANSPSKLSKVIGADGSVILLPFLNISGEDIQGEYDFNIDIGSEKPDNEATRRADLAATFSAIPPQMWAHIDIPKAVKHLLTVGLGPVVAAELQRDPKVVMQEQQAAAQMQFQQAMQLEQMKHVIPAQAKAGIAQMHGQTQLQTAGIQAQTQRDMAQLQSATQLAVSEKAHHAKHADHVFDAIVSHQPESPEK